ncbi:MAG: SagB/ThcOx family dehydrogenase [Vicinamibacterales bacterium]
MLPLEDPTSLSLLFHVNSEPWLNDDAYRTAPEPQEFKRHDAVLEECALPASPVSALTSLIQRRESCRAFARKTMPLVDVAALLNEAYGIASNPREDRQHFLRRSVPSAGGLFPLELYVILRRVGGLEDGVYHYDVLGHSLQLMRRGDIFPLLEPTFYTYPFIREANLVIAVSAVFLRTQKKYGPRGYRYILLEAGHVGQNVCLKASELGLATLCMGGFVDSELNALLQLPASREGVVYTIAAGYAAGSEHAGR